MNFLRSKYALFLIPLFLCTLVIITYILFPLSKYPESTTVTATPIQSTTISSSSASIADGLSHYLVDSISLQAPIITSINIPSGYKLDPAGILPSFITADGNQLVVNATKDDVGQYDIYLQDPLSDLYNETFYMHLTMALKPVDASVVVDQIKTALGDQADNYGIFVFDLKRDISFGFNENEGFRAASMVKVPIAITILREIEEGRLSLDTVYPLREDLIFNDQVGAGANPVGTPLTVRDYLTEMIEESDNTSLSHLDALLGETYGSGENQRIKDITGVDFYVNPPESTPLAVATVLKGLYSYSFLNKANSDYLIDLMKNALPDLKQGIAMGLPGGVEFANKIGFLDTDQDLSYMDSAIVYGTSTDYAVVIMDKSQDWDVAKSNIKTLSTIIYNNLN